jgi:hypothetical protein
MIAKRNSMAGLAPAAFAGTLVSSGLLMFISGSATSAPPPFEMVKGSWSGGGNLTLEVGKSEKLSCNGYYTSSGGGQKLGVALRCNGETNKFELRSHLSYDQGKVSGTWEERTFNASGDTSGDLKPGHMNLNFHGGVAGNMSVDFSESSQSIAISIATDGAAVAGAKISLRRN